MSDQSWRQQAACLGHPWPDIFFPTTGDAQTRSEAKEICRTCPVRDQCRAEAERTRSEGVWGGKTFFRPHNTPTRPIADIDHGTERGYRQHLRRGEKACPPCLEAGNYASRYRRYGLDTR